MTWKSTVLVSGATLVATWFASTPPLQHTPAPVSESTRPQATAGRASDDITREAERLRARLHPQIPYQQPARDPFRFGARPPTPASRRPATEPQQVDEPLMTVPAAPTLRVNLAGIAEDAAGGTTVRTAVISTPDDVLLVREGDTIAGQYRVTTITANSVELTRVSDGWVVRLSLRP